MKTELLRNEACDVACPRRRSMNSSLDTKPVKSFRRLAESMASPKVAYGSYSEPMTCHCVDIKSLPLIQRKQFGCIEVGFPSIRLQSRWDIPGALFAACS